MLKRARSKLFTELLTKTYTCIHKGFDTITTHTLVSGISSSGQNVVTNPPYESTAASAGLWQYYRGFFGLCTVGTGTDVVVLIHVY